MTASPRTVPELAGATDHHVFLSGGKLGRVEEIWFGPREEPLAAVVRLLDGRRGLLLAKDVAAVSHDDASVTVAPDVGLLCLEPPHLEASGDALSASWRTTGEPLELPPARRLSLSPALPGRLGDRPLWLTVLAMVATIACIVVLLIGLDIAIAYAVAGRPPY
jgi:hypothetical protein